MEKIRLNKYLAEGGTCSRREADQWISAGRVRKNGVRAALGETVGAEDIITVDGNPVLPVETLVYLAFHKPVGVEVTMDPSAKKGLTSVLSTPWRVFPVGRLDKDSSGLLLLTNDGDIVNRILRPEHAHEKEYLVHIDGAVTPAFLRRMGEGLTLEGGERTRTCHVTAQNPHAFRIVLTEGKHRQIRRMAASLGVKVTAIKRVRILQIRLGKLPRGAWRLLNKKEVRALKDDLGYRPRARQ